MGRGIENSLPTSPHFGVDLSRKRSYDEHNSSPEHPYESKNKYASQLPRNIPRTVLQKKS